MRLRALDDISLVLRLCSASSIPTRYALSLSSLLTSPEVADDVTDGLGFLRMRLSNFRIM